MAAKSKQMLYTKEGYQSLIDELSYLKNEKREEVKNSIKVARDFGDLSENSEYDEARNEQAKVEARIKELESLIENAVVVDESSIDASVISLGSAVKVYDEEFEEEVIYNIVGSNQADPLVGNISDLSPIGHALIGHKAGEEVTFETPGGMAHLKVLEVTRKTSND